MSVAIGQQAPEFSLPNYDRSTVSLSDLKGHKAVIVFIPFAFTGVCEGELCAIRDDLKGLENLGAKVVVITCNAAPSNGAWAKSQGFEFPILADFWPHGAVTQSYGAFNEALGCPNRFSFVLDQEGAIREIMSTDSLGTARSHDAYAAALEAIA